MGRNNVNEDIMEQEVLHVITEQYDKIFSAEKKVADFVLANPQEAVNSNVSELAKLSEVSDATVVRMCHHIGYTGYYQFRIALARDLGRQQQIQTTFAESKCAVQQVFREYAETMIAVGKRIDEHTVWNCVDLLKKADTVHIIAAGNASNLSQYMGFRLERMGIRSTYDNMPEYYINHINLCKEEDVLVAISKSGSSKSVIRGMELAKEKGLSCIAITASAQSPVSEQADYVLVSSGTQEPFTIKKSYAYMNEFAVVEALLSFIMNEDKMKSVDVDKPEVVLSEYKM